MILLFENNKIKWIFIFAPPKSLYPRSQTDIKLFSESNKTQSAKDPRFLVFHIFTGLTVINREGEWGSVFHHCCFFRVLSGVPYGTAILPLILTPAPSPGPLHSPHHPHHQLWSSKISQKYFWKCSWIYWRYSYLIQYLSRDE